MYFQKEWYENSGHMNHQLWTIIDGRIWLEEGHLIKYSQPENKLILDPNYLSMFREWFEII